MKNRRVSASLKQFSCYVIFNILLVACSNEAFNSGTGNRGGEEQNPEPTPTPTASPEPTQPPTPVDPCADGRVRKILIIDLKSGWFAGDGGQFFESLLDVKCADKLQISYIHITNESIQSNLDKVPGGTELMPCLNGQASKVFSSAAERAQCQFQSMTGYDQLWLLSGSEHDSDDVSLNSALFLNIQQRALELKGTNRFASFFFGAGLGNTDHANALFANVFATTNLASKPLFSNSPGTTLGTFPSEDLPKWHKQQPLVLGDGIKAGTFSNKLPSFADVTEIFDYAPDKNRVAAIGECFTDPISHPSINKMATDGCGQTAIGWFQSGEHTIYVDGNLARFYGTAPEEYFHRVINALNHSY